MTIISKASICLCGFLLLSCASRDFGRNGEVDIQEHKEFESVVTIESSSNEANAGPAPGAPTLTGAAVNREANKANTSSPGLAQPKNPSPSASAADKAKKSTTLVPPKGAKGKKQKADKKTQPTVPTPPPLPPPLIPPTAKTIEDRQGFVGRRPVEDPFFPGEEVQLDVSYFGVSAGTMTLGTRPYVKVNGRKAYHFYLKLQSNEVFSRIYQADDVAETYVDYQELIPLTHQVHLKETKRLVEGRVFVDWTNLTATKWEKKLTPDEGATEKKVSWAIEPFVQNVFSAPFYMRAFPLFPGKKLAFLVLSDDKNVTFTGEIVRRETLTTEVGTFDTVVLKPVIVTNGVFKQEGDILFWLTNDRQKLIVGFEGKIKIGKVKGTLKAIRRGIRPEN